MNYMDELFAQRKHFINTFYASKQNVLDNRNRLIACAYQLAKQQHPVFSNPDINTVLSILANDKTYAQSQLFLILQLYIRVYQNDTLVLDALYQQPDSRLQAIAPQLALIQHIDDHPLSVLFNETLLNNQLLVCYFRQQFDQIASFSKVHRVDVSLLTRLYLQVLNSTGASSTLLLDDFIANDYLDSELFELYVVNLPEKSLLALVNQLSADTVYIQLIIKVMGLSGYSRFIPFLARYLQDKTYTLNAHHSLRILLGEQLDLLIPNTIQFNSDEAQRIEDLSYYGAKILHHWDESILPTLGAHLLAGLPINNDNLDVILHTGSQVHRRVAALHKTQFPNNGAVFYYSRPEVVL